MRSCSFSIPSSGLLSWSVTCIIVCATYGLTPAPLRAQPVPMSFQMMLEPQIKTALWGVVHRDLNEPLWYALKVEDKRGQAIPHLQVKLTCKNQLSVNNLSGEDGWVFGALPLSCVDQKTDQLTPQSWRVQVQAAKRSVERVLSPLFTPRYLEGSWRVLSLHQSQDHLTYTLQHSLRVPHPLNAQVTLRPCLSEEQRSGIPVTQPNGLLNEQLTQEGHVQSELSKTISNQSVMGLRRIPLRDLQGHAGCYVLSVSSPPQPWAHLLEARALFWLKSRLELTVTERSFKGDTFKLSGLILPKHDAVTWEPDALKQALSTLALELRLTPSSSSQPKSADKSADKSVGVPVQISRPQWIEREQIKLGVYWSVKTPFPKRSEESQTYKASLHLTGGQTHHGESLLVARNLTPEAVSPLEYMFGLCIRPELWLTLLIIWLTTYYLRRVTSSRPLTAEEGPPLLNAPPLKPTWSKLTSSVIPPDRLGDADSEPDFIEIQLLDIESRSTIQNAKPDVYLSSPDLIFGLASIPQRSPATPEPGARVTYHDQGLIRVDLSALLCERLKREETLWLWVNIEGYEGCVMSVTAEHVSQRLKLPLWGLRAALKRQLSAMCKRNGLPLSFGRAALEDLRAHIKDVTLRGWIKRAERSLYSDQAQDPDESIAIAWGLSDARLHDALSPYDVRAHRTPHQRSTASELSPAHSTVSTFLFFLFFLFALTTPLQSIQADPVEQATTHQLSFKGWVNLLAESCNGAPKVSREIRLQDLKQSERVVLMNPYAIPSELLDWIKLGGKLLIAVEPQSALRSHRFLARLDLKVSAPSLDTTHSLATGIWWSEYAQDQGHLLPFIGSTMTHFIEGPSWYLHEIAPAWVDERGRSLGYRVKVGRGSIFLFGDADALSDDLISVASNQLSSLAFVEWLLHGATREQCPLVLTPPARILGAPSIEEQAAKSKLQAFLNSLITWLQSLIQWSRSLLTSSYGNQLIVTLLFGLWIVTLSRRLLKS